MKIEELYVRDESVSNGKRRVKIRANPVSRTSTPNIKTQRSTPRSKRGSKLVRSRNSVSNMKLEQLNKHEELSYMEDADANEAILKNTISKDELCRYLSPLKFLEIETWRQEVPCGDNLNEAEVDHRRWRTPIEILLPTAGRDDDDDVSLDDVITKADAIRGKKSVSAHGKRRRFFEDVQKQNAQMLQRSHSDAVNSETIRPRIREAFSAGEKPSTQRENVGQKSTKRPQNIPNGNLLKTVYAPPNGINIPPKKENITQKRAKGNPGRIHVNHPLPGSPLTHDAVMTSYFAPGRPVTQSQIRNRFKADLARDHLESAGGGPMRRLSSSNTKGSGVTLTSHSASLSSSTKRISSSSWPNINKEQNLHRSKMQEDVQILHIDDSRPQTAGDEVMANKYGLYQSRSKFRGAQRTLNRGWRTWNNRRAIENSLNAASKLYQNPVFPKKASLPQTINRSRTNRSSNSAREISSKLQPKNSSIETDNDEKLDSPNPSKDTVPPINTNHVTKISYSLGRIPENKYKINHTTKDKDITRVAPIQSIDMQLLNNDKHLNFKFSDADKEVTHVNSTTGIKYLDSDGRIIQLSPIKNGKRVDPSPWVAEAFNPVWAASEGYYVKQRPNKTVTFRLGST